MKTRILVLGEDTWSARLAEGLNRYSDYVIANSVRISDNRAATWTTLREAMRCDVVVRVGYPPPVFPHLEQGEQRADASASTREQLKSRLFRYRAGRLLRKLVLWVRLGPSWRRRFLIDKLLRLTHTMRLRRKDFTYWIGSDVQDAVEAARARRLPERYLKAIRNTQNITGIERLTEELSQIGIEASTAPYPGRMVEAPAQVAPMPRQMRVLSYVPESRRAFYGLPCLMEAARALPEVDFMIMGDTGTGIDNPPRNMHFFGFVREPAGLYECSSVVVRLVPHDGAGYSMAEGLLFARRVIYSYASPFVEHVPYGDEAGLIVALRDLYQQHLHAGIPLNLDGREWAMREYDTRRRFLALLETLLS